MLVAMPTAMPPEPFTRQVRKARREAMGLLARRVEVRLERHRVAVDVGEQSHRKSARAALGVAVGAPPDRLDGAELPARRRSMWGMLND